MEIFKKTATDTDHDTQSGSDARFTAEERESLHGCDDVLFGAVVAQVELNQTSVAIDQAAEPRLVRRHFELFDDRRQKIEDLRETLAANVV